MEHRNCVKNLIDAAKGLTEAPCRTRGMIQEARRARLPMSRLNGKERRNQQPARPAMKRKIMQIDQDMQPVITAAGAVRGARSTPGATVLGVLALVLAQDVRVHLGVDGEHDHGEADEQRAVEKAQAAEVLDAADDGQKHGNH